ncbi:hypothetical protein GCM10009805_25650 [Leucobacter chromiireducens subsp. solipictus]
MAQLLGDLAVLRGALLFHRGDGLLELAQALTERGQLLQHALLLALELGAFSCVVMRIPEPFFESVHSGFCRGELFAEEPSPRFGVEPGVLGRERHVAFRGGRVFGECGAQAARGASAADGHADGGTGAAGKQGHQNEQQRESDRGHASQDGRDH